MTDSGNNRVQEFSPTGTFLRQFGSSGTGAGQFRRPTGIALDQSGNVWVLNTHGVLAQKFSATGTYISGFGSSGWFTAGGSGLAVSGREPVRHRTARRARAGVLDARATSLAILRRTGLRQRQVPDSLGHRPGPDHGQPLRLRRRLRPHPGVQPDRALYPALGSAGSGNGQFSGPKAVAVGAAGDVYIADTRNNRVEEWRCHSRRKMQAEQRNGVVAHQKASLEALLALVTDPDASPLRIRMTWQLVRM